MIIFWIFTFFVGASAFAFAYIFLQLGVLYSLGYALLVMLLCRGILSMARRWLILRERMSPETDPLTRTVDVHIAWLREKIEDDPKNPQYIVTVHGQGYRFSR